MGLLDSVFGGDAPERQIAHVDPQTQKLMDQNTEQAAAGIDSGYKDIDRNLQTGTDAYKSFNSNGLLGGGMNDAIKEKYGRVLANTLSNARSGYQQNAREMQLQKMQMAQAAYLSQQDTQNNAYAAQMEAHQMQEAARAQAIGSIIGAGGMAAGMWAGGMFNGKPSPTQGGPRGNVSYQSAVGPEQSSRNMSQGYVNKLAMTGGNPSFLPGGFGE